MKKYELIDDKRSLFSFRILSNSNIKLNEDKFEFVSCPLEGKYCRQLLPVINRKYSDAQQYRIDKEYVSSIRILRKAHEKTFDLKKPYCVNCAEFFRTTINDSIYNIKEEQNEISKRGFLMRRHKLTTISFDPELKKFKKGRRERYYYVPFLTWFTGGFSSL